MSALDWFANKSSQFDTKVFSGKSDKYLHLSTDTAVSLINPELKFLHPYREVLASAVENSLDFIREIILSLPEAVFISASEWHSSPFLRAFFASESDIPVIMRGSKNLRVFLDKHPRLDRVWLILDMNVSEKDAAAEMSLLGSDVCKDRFQKTVNFSDHKIHICGADEAEAHRLFGAQCFEYLVAQALHDISQRRTERQDLEEERAMLRARLRSFQQRGSGPVFNPTPEKSEEKMKLDALLLENERQMRAGSSTQSALESELECLRDVLKNPGRFIFFENKQQRLNRMNVIVSKQSLEAASDVSYSLIRLMGTFRARKACVVAHFSRNEMPEVVRANFADAARYL